MEKTVPVQGAELFYSTRGHGPACLVLSRIGTRPYERMMPPGLCDRLQLVFVDPRGSGRSTGEPTDLTFDLLAGDLEAIRSFPTPRCRSSSRADTSRSSRSRTGLSRP